MKEQSGQNQCCKTFSWDCPGEAVIAPIGSCRAQTRGSFWVPLREGVLLPWPGVPVQGRVPSSSSGGSHSCSRSCCPAENGEMQKAHWVPAGSSGSSGWSLCLAQPPSSTQPCREWVSPDQPEHVPSPTGCWQHDASSSLCLKAVKNNLFLKSAPEKRCPGPPRRLLHGSRGWGDPGSKIIPGRAGVLS